MSATRGPVRQDAPTPAERILRPFQEFLRIEASAGILLLACTVAALLWANSSQGSAYFALARVPVTIGIGTVALSKPILIWINDGLMAVFFLVVGLEIKREVLVGELSSRRKAVLPIFAAAGGMIVPAAIYLLLNSGTDRSAGWGIPVATDIAFAIGVLTLFGKRVPLGLKVFLTALAIADDLGAVLVIALFYGEAPNTAALLAAAGMLALLVAANWARVRSPFVFGVLGVGLWLAVLQSGVHPTVAGVLLAMTIPSRSRIDSRVFLSRSRSFLDDFENRQVPGRDVLTDAGQQAALHALEEACEEVSPPLERIERALHPWATYLVMPVFACFNAAVVVEGSLASTLSQPAALGVVLGLVVGKPVGIVLFSWVAVRLGVGDLPEGIRWLEMLGVACLAGIGFTMSLFIAGLAFDGLLLAAAKVGILCASAAAGALGGTILWVATRRSVSRVDER